MKSLIPLVLLLLLVSCAAAPQRIYDAKASSKGSAVFARNVVDRQAVSYFEGLQGIVIFAVGTQRDMTFKGCVTFLSQKKVIPMNWGAKYRQNSALTRGMLAHMLVNALGIRGGLTIQVFGNSPRYALRECNKLGIIKKGSQNSPVSGREFLSILRKAEEYAAGNSNKD